MTERAIAFRCGDDWLIGVLHQPAGTASSGVVIVVGGPQYRVGSHRQLVLLARHLAAHGHAVLRFDYRGMGDSDGSFVGFEGITDDIAAAVACLRAEVPGLDRLALSGLCDAASAIAMYAARDPRISGIVLVNPWVRTEAGLARVHVHRYYRQRLRSRDFWRRLLTARIDIRRAARPFAILAGDARTRIVGVAGTPAATPAAMNGDDGRDRPLPERVGAALRRFAGRVLIVLSANDLTAQEFEESVMRAPAMRRWLRRPAVTIRTLPEANHTYSRAAWRDRLHDWVSEWLAAGVGDGGLASPSSSERTESVN